MLSINNMVTHFEITELRVLFTYLHFLYAYIVCYFIYFQNKITEKGGVKLGSLPSEHQTSRWQDREMHFQDKQARHLTKEKAK